MLDCQDHRVPNVGLKRAHQPTSLAVERGM
jgi:hypothetical protein